MYEGMTKQSGWMYEVLTEESACEVYELLTLSALKMLYEAAAKMASTSTTAQQDVTMNVCRIYAIIATKKSLAIGYSWAFGSPSPPFLESIEIH